MSAKLIRRPTGKVPSPRALTSVNDISHFDLAELVEHVVVRGVSQSFRFSNANQVQSHSIACTRKLASGLEKAAKDSRRPSDVLAWT